MEENNEFNRMVRESAAKAQELLDAVNTCIDKYNELFYRMEGMQKQIDRLLEIFDRGSN